VDKEKEIKEEIYDEETGEEDKYNPYIPVLFSFHR
jgi:hypothetical protein